MSPKGSTKKTDSLLIELKNITRSFGYGEVESFALNDFNLEVKAGEFIMIMGPSGCGKTTLLNILGLLDFPTSGSYYLDSERTTFFSKARQAHIRAQKIGFIFQDFNLIPRMTILENVALPLIYAGVGKTKRLIRSSEMLKYLNMQKHEYYYPYQLSGGQKQRVAIARALVSSPEIILADEPTGNLDSRNAHLVMEELRRIHSEGNTIIMVTHNPNLTTYATRVIHMLDGRIATDVKTVADEDLPERIKVHFSPKKVILKSKQTPPTLPSADTSPVVSSVPHDNYPEVSPDSSPRTQESSLNPTQKTSPISYKYPTSSEISITPSNSPTDKSSPKSTNSEIKSPVSKKVFPVVSSISNDSSVRVVKKVPTLEELETITPPKKSKIKSKNSRNIKTKPAKGRRK